MEDEKICDEEVWSAIRYLDPDQHRNDNEVINASAIIAILALLLVFGGVWVLLWLKVRPL